MFRFRNHPVNDFVKPLLNNYNIDEFNVFCCSNIQNTNTDLFKILYGEISVMLIHKMLLI